MTRSDRILERMKQPPSWAALLVLGQGDDGEFYLPCVDRSHRHPELIWWDRRLDLGKPSHWPYYALTWITGWVVWLES